jgi:hypothetical protein
MKRACSIVLASLVLSSQVFALETSGYFKSWTVGTRPVELYDAPASYKDDPQLSQLFQLRLSATKDLGSGIRGEASLELQPAFQPLPGTSLPSTNATSAYRIVKMNQTIVPQRGSNLVAWQNLDRFFFVLSTGDFDIQLGRQPIAFGNGRSVNPTDLFSPFSTQAIDTEERSGVDALRVRYALGELSELDVAYIAGENAVPATSAGYLRFKSHIANTDWSILAASYQKNALAGIDIAGAIGDFGVWLEGAHTWVGAIEHRKSNQDFSRIVVGTDRTIGDGTFVFAEYHYNSAGLEHPANTLAHITSHAGYTSGSVFLSGRYYLSLGVTNQMDPLNTFSSSLLWNLKDASSQLSLAWSNSLAENTSLTVGFFLGNGRVATATSAGNVLTGATARSEFGMVPDLLYTGIRHYF